VAYGKLWRYLQRRAENVAAGLLAVMFVTFILQIVFRYLFNFPIGWSTELTILTWVYLVLWGSAFVLTEKEEIRFDLIYSSVGPRVRIAMAIICSVSIVALYSLALPATYAYVSFMKVEKSSYLKIPLNWEYSIFLVFFVAVIARYLWLLSRLLRGKDPETTDVTKVSSGL